MPPCEPAGPLISLCLSMPCKLSPLVPLSLADAVGDRVQVGRHHVQLVGLELPAEPGPECVVVAVVVLDDDLAYPVRIHAPRHVERAPPPLPVSSLQRTLPSVLAPANLTSIPELERPQWLERDEKRGHYQRRQHVRHPYLLELQEAEPEAQEQHAAGRGHRQDHRLAHKGPEERPGKRQTPLHDEDRPGREQYAPPEHRGERERGHEVQRALEREQPVVARDPVLQGAQDRERPHAKQQARRDESPAHRAPAFREAPLQGVAEALQPSVYVQELPDHEPQYHADQRDERVVEAQEALDADEEGYQPDGVHG